MKKAALFTVAALSLTAFTTAGMASQKKEAKGEELFKAKCAMCHPNGGNAMKADKTLSRKDLQKNNLKNKKDIVAYMRKPGPGMTVFDAKTLPEKDAKEIAEYIMKSFK